MSEWGNDLDTPAAPIAMEAGIPPVLRSLRRLSSSFLQDGQRICFVRADPASSPQTMGNGHRPEGYAGDACLARLDQTAGAALLALQVYDHSGSRVAIHLARGWLAFLCSMQEPDGRFINAILDEQGLVADSDGWGSVQAQWALAAAVRLTGHLPYLDTLQRAHLATTRDVRVQAIQVLALAELAVTQVDSGHILQQIGDICDAMVTGGFGCYQRRPGEDVMLLAGCHQVRALARAALLLHRRDYTDVCEAMVRRLIEPVIAQGFRRDDPNLAGLRGPDEVAAMACGLEEAYLATRDSRYHIMAIHCSSWLDGDNAEGRPLYDYEAGCCAVADWLWCGGVAESAIAVGMLVECRHRLLCLPRVPTWDVGLLPF